MGEPLFVGFTCRGARDCKNYVRDTIPFKRTVDGFGIFQAAAAFRQGFSIQYMHPDWNIWHDYLAQPDPFEDFLQDLKWRLKP
jgi:hypothetical protein